MTVDRRPRWFVPALAGVLYFSQGFPFGIIDQLMPLYLRIEKVSLTQIGFLSTIGLAWTWKVVWSPLVDLYGSYRRWIAGALVVITSVLAALTVVHPSQTALFWTLLTLLVFASATQDIAIDAMAIRITPQNLLGYVNSIRVTAYRGAMIVAGGALAAVTPVVGWPGAFAIAAALTAAVLAFTTLMPRERGERKQHENPFRGLAQWMKRPHAIFFLLVTLLYRVGDAALVPMVKPFWVDRGYSAAEIGTVTTIIGLSLLIAGAFAGGAVVSRKGIYFSLLWLGILAMLSNVGYAVAAMTGATRPLMYGVAMVENFTGGLGTAAFLAFLMSICDREHAATQFAMLSAIFALSRTTIGTFSGILSDQLGYAPYFWITVALGIPALLLLPLIRSDLANAPEISGIDVASEA